MKLARGSILLKSRFCNGMSTTGRFHSISYQKVILNSKHSKGSHLCCLGLNDRFLLVLHVDSSNILNLIFPLKESCCNSLLFQWLKQQKKKKLDVPFNKLHSWNEVLVLVKEGHNGDWHWTIKKKKNPHCFMPQVCSRPPEFSKN